jgi:hypothetical protein
MIISRIQKPGEVFGSREDMKIQLTFPRKRLKVVIERII